MCIVKSDRGKRNHQPFVVLDDNDLVQIFLNSEYSSLGLVASHPPRGPGLPAALSFQTTSPFFCLEGELMVQDQAWAVPDLAFLRILLIF